MINLNKNHKDLQANMGYQNKIINIKKNNTYNKDFMNYKMIMKCKLYYNRHGEKLWYH